MKTTSRNTLLLALLLPVANTAYSDNTNPYANMPPGAMGGLDVQKMMQAQQARDEKKKKKEAERKAISKAIADEELAKAKAEASAGNDPYAIAEVRTRKRMQPIYTRWKQEDAAEHAALENQARQNARQLQQTGDYAEYGRQQQEMLRQMGIAMPPPGQ